MCEGLERTCEFTSFRPCPLAKQTKTNSHLKEETPPPPRLHDGRSEIRPQPELLSPAAEIRRRQPAFFFPLGEKIERNEAEEEAGKEESECACCCQPVRRRARGCCCGFGVGGRSETRKKILPYIKNTPSGCYVLHLTSTHLSYWVAFVVWLMYTTRPPASFASQPTLPRVGKSKNKGAGGTAGGTQSSLILRGRHDSLTGAS